MPTPRAGYFLANGEKVPGVTTILNRWKESGGLLQWAFQQGKSGAANLYEQRDAAADIGTLAHAMVENVLEGNDPEAALALATDEQKAKARQAYSMFVTWRERNRADIISIETPMVSESLRIGGTPDIALCFEQLEMGDIKTSNGIYRDHLMQVAAYRVIWNENHPTQQMTGGFHILRFAKDYPDFEHRYFAELDDALECFKWLRQAYDLDQRLKKRAA